MKVLIAQLNPTIGDFSANTHKIIDAMAQAENQQCDLVVTPEMALSGYPPRDLLDRHDFIRASMQALRSLSSHVGSIPLLVGSIIGAKHDPLATSGPIANALVLIANGQIHACHHKILLPTYDIFDEGRYFTSGKGPTIVTVKNHRIALSVCEDIWQHNRTEDSMRYDTDPVQLAAESGAEILINVSASPYNANKPAQRHKHLSSLAKRHQLPVLYVNQVGGNDSIIFDGNSLAADADGSINSIAPPWIESLQVVEYMPSKHQWHAAYNHTPTNNDVMLQHLEALCLGLRDYVQKCGFKRVVLGLSGGIDSALTAAIAHKALGADKVQAIAMPSQYSSEGSILDSQQFAKNFNIKLDIIPISPMFDSYLHALSSPFANTCTDTTEENLQARIRGNILMAYSNKFNSLLLTTGNKSETAIGYCTLYGDMSGGLALISDLYKTEVYKMADSYNAHHEAQIPTRIIQKAPSAELRPDQKDTDSLPPYDILDNILHKYIDQSMSIEQIIDSGHQKEMVCSITHKVTMNEYKRRQMAPGLRVSTKAFGEGRRLPIAHNFHGITVT